MHIRILETHTKKLEGQEQYRYWPTQRKNSSCILKERRIQGHNKQREITWKKSIISDKTCVPEFSSPVIRIITSLNLLTQGGSMGKGKRKEGKE